MPVSAARSRQMPGGYPGVSRRQFRQVAQTTRLALQRHEGGVETLWQNDWEVAMSSPTAVMALLEKKVPITLLLDLIDADHMPSRVILRREPADLSWLGTPHPRPDND